MRDRKYALIIAFIASAIAILRDLYLYKILEKNKSRFVASSLLMLIIIPFLLVVRFQDKNYTIIISLIVLVNWIYTLYNYIHEKSPKK